MVSSREFLEYVKNDLKGIKADLRYNQRLHHELLYEIHQQITEHKEHLLKEITNRLDKPEETKTKLSEYRGRPHSKK